MGDDTVICVRVQTSLMAENSTIICLKGDDSPRNELGFMRLR